MILKNLGRLIVISSLLGLAQCGDVEDADTKAISFTHIPDKPIVIEADYTKTLPAVGDAEPEKMEIKGPWFQSVVQFTNNSELPLVVQTVKYTVEAVGVDGNLVVLDAFLDPGDLARNKNESVVDDQDFVAFIPVGATSDGNAVWYIDALPDRLKIGRLKYRLKLEALGWFGTSDAPVKAFRKTINIQTDDTLN